MNKSIIILSLFILNQFCSNAQSVPVNPYDCGWSYLYDNTGNRVARAFINCNPPNNNSAKKDDSNFEDIPLAESDNNYESSEISLALYPNPTKSDFVVEFNEELADVSITIMDNNGRLIYTIKGDGKSFPLNLTNQTSGTYIVKIKTRKKDYIKSVVKRD